MGAGYKERYFTAADLVETIFRGMADNSVGRVIDDLLRNDLVIIDEVGFAPLDDTGAQLLFRFAAAYERRALGIGSHWPFDQWGPLPARAHHRRQHGRPAAPPQHRRGRRRRVLPHET
ncbi:ATP-binding protein [Microbispora sp. NBC_01389]|uniref:ATP-binding protein n=1 Tax=Microbispora sp. NBC_01389 TaxID=2903584 RepID=UPI003865AB68